MHWNNFDLVTVIYSNQKNKDPDWVFVPFWVDLLNLHLFETESQMECSSNHIHGLVQERRNFIANALAFRLSCTNPSI